MTYSIPGVLVSRDGLVRQYIGHSNRGGTLYGRVTHPGKFWSAHCSGCGMTFGGNLRGDVVRRLRDHWDNADAMMAATHIRDAS